MTRTNRVFVWAVAVMLLVVVASVLHAQQGTVSTQGVGTAGVHIEAGTEYPDVAVKTGNTTTSAFRVFNAANTELLRVGAAGLSVAAGGAVAVGGTAPAGYQR